MASSALPPPRVLTQGNKANLISTVKSDTVDFAVVCKGVLITVAGNLNLVPSDQTAVVGPLAVNVGDVIDMWELRRINETGTSADGWTIEG